MSAPSAWCAVDDCPAAICGGPHVEIETTLGVEIIRADQQPVGDTSRPADRGHAVRRQPQVFTEQCSTCVFRPGNPMRLAPGRLADLVRRNIAAGAALICHKTTFGQHPEIGETVCRGWFDRYGARTNSIRVVARLASIIGEDGDGFARVEPPQD